MIFPQILMTSIDKIIESLNIPEKIGCAAINGEHFVEVQITMFHDQIKQRLEQMYAPHGLVLSDYFDDKLNRVGIVISWFED